MRNSKPQSNFGSQRVFVVRWDERRRKFVARDDAGHVLAAASARRPVLQHALLGANLASCFGVGVTVMVADRAGQIRPAYFAKPRMRA